MQAELLGWALKEILNRYKLLDYFDKVFFSDEIGFVKPNKIVLIE